MCETLENESNLVEAKTLIEPQQHAKSDDYLPFVTVILPVRNEGNYIARSLEAVLAQDYPAKRMEILVADGMSTDKTRQIAAKFAEGGIDLRLIDNPGRIVATGLNLAVEQARGEILVRVDGHCVIAADYVRNCVKHLQSEDLAGVGGPMETIGETPMAETIALGMSTKFGVGGSAFRTQHGQRKYVETVPFPAYWKRDVLLAGPFDSELVRNQDDEYNYRLRSMGGKLLLTPDVTSRYFSRSSLASLWRQYYQYGFYKVRVMQKHPAQMQWRQFIPPLFVAGLVVLLLGSIFSSWFRILFAVYAGVYLLLNLAASLRAAQQNGWRHLVLLPLVYLILHTSYGAGFWSGMIHFARRWGDRGSPRRFEHK